MQPTSKTKMVIYQSNANLDEEVLFGKSHLCDPTIRKMPERGFYEEWRVPSSILVHDLCGIEVYIANLKYRISIEGRSLTRMDCGVFVPSSQICPLIYHHLPNF